MPRPGEQVLVPTAVKDGAFPDEKLVMVDTLSGQISGFAKADYIRDIGGGTYLIGEVREVSGSSSMVRLFGSFFTTTGLASIANARLRAAR